MDAKPALDPHQDHLDRLRDFGYNEQEARFLFLAATHSGYFTRHQFLSFTHQTKGCLVHRFTTKLLTQHHAQATQYGHKTYVFKLTSRKIYDLIGKQDLRDHRSHTADFIRKTAAGSRLRLGPSRSSIPRIPGGKTQVFPRTIGRASQPFPRANRQDGGPRSELEPLFQGPISRLRFRQKWKHTRIGTAHFCLLRPSPSWHLLVRRLPGSAPGFLAPIAGLQSCLRHPEPLETRPCIPGFHGDF